MAFTVAFSADSSILAAGGVGEQASGDVRRWELSTGKELAPLHGHGDGVFAVAFSAGGRTLAVGGRDKAIHLWEVASGRERGRLVGHDGGVLALCFSHDGRRLLSSSFDSTGLVWDLSDWGSDQPPRGELSLPQLQRYWQGLASEDPRRAWRAVWMLAGAPLSVAFLGQRLRPAAPVDAAQVARWIAELDAEDFAVRQRAAAALSELGEIAAPALHRALEVRPSAEVRRRLGELLQELSRPSPRQLQQVRALEALEYADTPAARHILEELAGGAPQARLTLEARAALGRLAGRR
jgi:hypothetical protein